jgi:hypothetical protein
MARARTCARCSRSGHASRRAASTAWCVLPLPAEVLSSVRADLADLRVFIDDGSVEFVIEADAPQRATETRALVPVDVRERTAGDPTRPTVVETWDVVLPTDLPGAATAAAKQAGSSGGCASGSRRASWCAS